VNTTFVRRAAWENDQPTWHVDIMGKGKQWQMTQDEPMLDRRYDWSTPAVLARCRITTDDIPMVYLADSLKRFDNTSCHQLLEEGTYDSLWESFLAHARML
jgi:hypothetical protein